MALIIFFHFFHPLFLHFLSSFPLHFVQAGGFDVCLMGIFSFSLHFLIDRIMRVLSLFMCWSQLAFTYVIGLRMPLACNLHFCFHLSDFFFLFFFFCHDSYSSIPMFKCRRQTFFFYFRHRKKSEYPLLSCPFFVWSLLLLSSSLYVRFNYLFRYLPGGDALNWKCGKKDKRPKKE